MSEIDVDIPVSQPVDDKPQAHDVVDGANDDSQAEPEHEVTIIPDNDTTHDNVDDQHVDTNSDDINNNSTQIDDVVEEPQVDDDNSNIINNDTDNPTQDPDNKGVVDDNVDETVIPESQPVAEETSQNDPIEESPVIEEIVKGDTTPSNAPVEPVVDTEPVVEESPQNEEVIEPEVVEEVIKEDTTPSDIPVEPVVDTEPAVQKSPQDEELIEPEVVVDAVKEQNTIPTDIPVTEVVSEPVVEEDVVEEPVNNDTVDVSNDKVVDEPVNVNIHVETTIDPLEAEIPPLKERITELEDEAADLREQIQRIKDLLEKNNDIIAQLEIEKAQGHAFKSDQPLIKADAKSSSRVFGQVTLRMRKNRQDKLLAVRNQIIAWMNRLLKLNDNPILIESFMERLSTGVLLCDLVRSISDEAFPSTHRIHRNALPYSMWAIDNAQSFLNVCYDWGLKKIQCFASSDLMSTTPSNRNERLVVETIFSLSRIAYLKYEIEPPDIIKTELEIDGATFSHGKPLMTAKEMERLQQAIDVYCAMHGITNIPQATSKRGQYQFLDGSVAHVRLFQCGDENVNYDGDIADLVHAGDVALLVRHNNAWEELHQFIHDHSDPTKNVKTAEQLAEEERLRLEAEAEAERQRIEEEEHQKELERLAAEAKAREEALILEERRLQKEARREAARKAREEARSKRLAEIEQRRQAAEDDLNQKRQIWAEELKEAEKAQHEAERLYNTQKELLDKELALQKETVDRVLNVRKKLANGEALTGDEADVDIGQALGRQYNIDDYKKYKAINMNEINIMNDEAIQDLAEYTAKQEFFYLTSLAVKLTHELRDASMPMPSNEELWRRLLDRFNGIPFTLFYTFVYKELTKEYLEQHNIDVCEKRLLAHTDVKTGGMPLRSRRELLLSNYKSRIYLHNQQFRHQFGKDELYSIYGGNMDKVFDKDADRTEKVFEKDTATTQE